MGVSKKAGNSREDLVQRKKCLLSCGSLGWEWGSRVVEWIQRGGVSWVKNEPRRYIASENNLSTSKRQNLTADLARGGLGTWLLPQSLRGIQGRSARASRQKNRAPNRQSVRMFVAKNGWGSLFTSFSVLSGRYMPHSQSDSSHLVTLGFSL